VSGSGTRVRVAKHESILEALARAGFQVPSSCREGICGTCETAVVSGVPDHRDSVLTDDERAAGTLIMPCVSRSRIPEIELDLF
jgi:ferredoxin